MDYDDLLNELRADLEGGGVDPTTQALLTHMGNGKTLIRRDDYERLLTGLHSLGETRLAAMLELEGRNFRRPSQEARRLSQVELAIATLRASPEPSHQRAADLGERVFGELHG